MYEYHSARKQQEEKLGSAEEREKRGKSGIRGKMRKSGKDGVKYSIVTISKSRITV
jgi:hypothetical protein